MSSRSVATAREITALVSRLNRRFREVGTIGEISPSQASVLDRLDKEGPASTSALARIERVRPQSMAATVAALEKRGFVERRPDLDDRRSHLVALTRATGTRIEVNRQDRQDWLATALARRFTAAERQQISETVRLLARLTDE